MNVSRPYITKVLHGDVNITLGSALRFAKALEMDFIPQLVEKGELPGANIGEWATNLKPQYVKPAAFSGKYPRVPRELNRRERVLSGGIPHHS